MHIYQKYFTDIKNCILELHVHLVMLIKKIRMYSLKFYQRKIINILHV